MAQVEQERSGTARGAIGSPWDSIIVWVLAVGFFTVAGWFFFAPKGSCIPLSTPEPVAAADIDPSPRPAMLSDPPKALINNFERTCMDCHAILDGEPRSEDLRQHSNIHLEHGLNTRCVNCHHPEDRDKLISNDLEPLPYAEVAMLCAQCHGPVFRQWERGTHGKTLGFWDSNRGDSRHLTCTECHDPHHPRFDPIAPLPAPRTLRMGPQDPHGGHHGGSKHNPLTIPMPHGTGSNSSAPTTDGHPEQPSV